jgi:glutamate/tyrosine decarboxylase-like PLP-dependent enzyme
MIGRHCALARRLASRLQTIPGVAVVNDVVLNQLAVTFDAGAPPARQNAMTRATIEELQSENICFAAGAQWKGRDIMRVSIIAASLQVEDIDRLASAIAAAFARAQARMPRDDQHKEAAR